MAHELASDPGFLAYRFNFSTENVEFLPIDRSDIRRVSALKHDFIDASRNLVAVPLGQLVPLLDSAAADLREAPPRFIFHTAFCASTFLSRILDVDGATISLREPQLLLDAANAKRLQWKSMTTDLDYRGLIKLALSLLAKHASTGEKLLIKPINSINNIIPELLQTTPGSRSLLLYTDVRNFVLSTLRKGEGGKQTVRSMFDLLRCDFPHLVNLRLTDTIHMTDLRIALTLWRLQLEQAEQALSACSPDRALASLYGERLIDQPAGNLLAANRFLDLGIPDDRIRSIIESDERSRDAKNQAETFSPQKRAERYRLLEDFYGSDLDLGVQWMLTNNPQSSEKPVLSRSLESQA